LGFHGLSISSILPLSPYPALFFFSLPLTLLLSISCFLRFEIYLTVSARPPAL
jgi:hypothetical protein